MSLAISYGMKKKARKMAEGGMAGEMSDCPPADNRREQEDGDIVDRIMKARGYSKGGRVANDTSDDVDSEPNEFDDLVLRDDLEGEYVHPNDGPGNEQENDDRQDIIERIMRSRRLKDRNSDPA